MALRIVAYCGKDWIKASKAAAKVTPFTCPPVSSEDVTTVLEKASRSDLFYLNLHGYVGQGNYFGQENNVVGPTALTPEQVTQYRWDGVVVFAEVCFSAQDGGGAMAHAFLVNGAKAFIGSTTEAYGRVKPTIWDGEADRLMYLFWRCYDITRNPAQALEQAKRWLKVLSFPLDKDDKATLASFVCLTGEQDADADNPQIDKG
jgi:hypothetical protein